MRFSVWIKMVMFSIMLLAVPLIGFRYAATMTSFLLSSQEQALSLTARAVTTSLNGRPELFQRNILQSLDASREIHAYAMEGPVQLDGDLQDWGSLLREVVLFDEANVLTGAKESSLSFRHILGRHESYLYFLFQVNDEKILYRQKDFLHLERNDHLQIALEDPHGRFRRYLVAPIESGWVTAHLMPDDTANFVPVKNETRIQGVWQEKDDGYVVEMRIPLDLIGSRLAFAVADVDDDESRELETVVGTGPGGKPADLGVLMASSPELERLLKALERPAVKIWVVDRIKRVRARVGGLAGPVRSGESGELWRRWLQRVLRWDFSLFPRAESPDSAVGGSYLEEFDLEIIDEALQGRALTARRSVAGYGSEIVVAVEPLFGGEEILGAVVVEQTTDNILSEKQKIIEDVIALTLLIFVVGALINFTFATSISRRIIRLSSSASNAIGGDGRIKKSMVPSRVQDEIGDLSRTLAEMLTRLEGFHQYREKMADNLEHELRTPLAGISASLLNLQRELEDHGWDLPEYLEGALGNVRRIEAILARIRDATMLEEALRHDEVEDFDLVRALAIWHQQGYGPAFPGRAFRLELPEEEEVVLRAEPGRIHQMFDKLVENAVDFSLDGSEIILGLKRDRKQVCLTVTNEGVELAAGDGERIFNSMVSLRKGGDGPHMGLGLYIVRTIATFLGGTVAAANRQDGVAGVVITVRLPLVD